MRQLLIRRMRAAIRNQLPQPLVEKLLLLRAGGRKLLWRIRDRVVPDSRARLRRRTVAVQLLGRSVALSGNQTDDGFTANAARGVRLDDTSIIIFIPSLLNGAGGAEKVAGQVANLLLSANARVEIACRPAASGKPTYSVDPRVRFQLLDQDDDDAIRQLAGNRYDLMIGFGMSHFFRRIPHIANLLGTPFVIQECTNPGRMALDLVETTDCQNADEAAWLRQSVLAHAAAVRLTNRIYLESVCDSVRPFAYAFYNAFEGVQEATMAPERRIICVGAMKNRNKNGLAAVRAFIAFAQGRPDWTLDLYGVNNFKAELNSLKASAAVRINDHGVVQGAATIYQNAHALVIPSYEEGLPNVVVEAFSFGVPCIGYRDCIAVAALIEHEVTGLLVERSDPDDLARALVRLADPQEHARMAANAIAFARQNFQPSNWRQNWLEMVANACAGVDRFGQGRLPPARRNDVHGKYWRDILAAHRPIG